MTMIFIPLIIPPNLETSQWHQVINYYLHTLTSPLTFEKENRKKEEKKNSVKSVIPQNTLKE